MPGSGMSQSAAGMHPNMSHDSGMSGPGMTGMPVSSAMPMSSSSHGGPASSLHMQMAEQGGMPPHSSAGGPPHSSAGGPPHSSAGGHPHSSAGVPPHGQFPAGQFACAVMTFTNKYE
jgi:hypothetical protein